jgi:hypothetical protein
VCLCVPWLCAPCRWRLVSAASLPSLLSSTDPQASGRNGRGASTAADAGPRLLRSLVREGWRGGAGLLLLLLPLCAKGWTGTGRAARLACITQLHGMLYVIVDMTSTKQSIQLPTSHTLLVRDLVSLLLPLYPPPPTHTPCVACCPRRWALRWRWRWGAAWWQPSATTCLPQQVTGVRRAWSSSSAWPSRDS